MLTADFLQRFLFKWKYAIVIVLTTAVVVILLSLRIDRWLPDYALSYSNLVAQQSRTKIEFKKASFRFPNHVVLQNVKVFGAHGKVLLLQASKVTMGFSLPLISRELSLKSMTVYDLNANAPALKQYWAANGPLICAWIKKIPQGDIRLAVPHGRVDLAGPGTKSPQAGHSQLLAVDFNVALQRNRNLLNIHGSWGDQPVFHYELDGRIRGCGLEVDKLTLQENHSLMNLWGHWYGRSIDWQGFAFYGKYYVLDIDGHLQLQDKNILLKHLSFTLDGNSVEVSGNCSRQHLFTCRAGITFHRQPQRIDAQTPLKGIHLSLYAQKSPYGVDIKGTSDLYFLFDPHSPTSLQSIHLVFKNLKPVVLNRDFSSLQIKTMQSVLSIGGRRYTVPLENMRLGLNYAKPYEKVITISADSFAGHAYSRIFLDTSTAPWEIKGRGRAVSLDINRLSDTFTFFKQGHGLLSGNFNIQASKELVLDGTLTLHQGDFSASDFQEWLVRVLQMPSLSRISNMELSGRFKIKGRAGMLDDVKLSADKFNLAGFYHVDADGLVSSRISLRFAKSALSESPIGRQVMGLVHGAWTLPFEFSLSGNAGGPNFQWDTSTLKDRVRRHMFSFFERMIDERMDEAPYSFTMQRESV
ncbi:MAG: hypothetical protein KGJ09_04250 [Candidatus Omnitrophica bacterium]|nr:hypothetical protein [Candidatus Omnitrophota bacterium]MDE2213793.1 hypothetical protein [Candidatus Omnitrophota bacterium]